MTPGLSFALGAMVCFGASDLIYKRAATAGIEASQFIMLQAWVFCPGITLYAWATGTSTLAGPSARPCISSTKATTSASAAGVE